MESHLILDTNVDALNNVYLTAGWPIRADYPAVVNRVSAEAIYDVSGHRYRM